MKLEELVSWQNQFSEEDVRATYYKKLGNIDVYQMGEEKYVLVLNDEVQGVVYTDIQTIEEFKKEVRTYSLDGLNTAYEIKQYVIKAMQQNKCGQTEIREYQVQADMYDFEYLLQISQEYLDMLESKPKNIKVSYMPETLNVGV